MRDPHDHGTLDLFADTDHERDELARADRAEKRAHARLMRHPDCRDPAHPGCPDCDPEPWEREPLPALYADPIQ